MKANMFWICVLISQIGIRCVQLVAIPEGHNHKVFWCVLVVSVHGRLQNPASDRTRPNCQINGNHGFDQIHILGLDVFYRNVRCQIEPAKHVNQYCSPQQTSVRICRKRSKFGSVGFQSDVRTAFYHQPRSAETDIALTYFGCPDYAFLRPHLWRFRTDHKIQAK